MVRRSKLRSWGLAALALVAAAASTACQDGYPIAPTLCDEWCDQTRHIFCDGYDPAACVAACEKQGLSREPCADLLRQALQCLREAPRDELNCESRYSAAAPCGAEETTVLECSSTQAQGSPQD